MSTQVQWKRGSTTQNNTYTGAVAEITIDTTLKQIRLHDGVTAGGTVIGSTAVTVSTATNVANGLAGQILYQAAAGQTGFITPGPNGSFLISNGTTSTFGNTVTNLTVSGQSILQSVTATLFTATTVTVNGNATVGGTFGVTGQTTLQSVTATLFTATTVTVNGNETVGGTLGVTGLTTLQSVTATLFTATTVTVNGNETVGGTLGVTGQTTLAGLTATNITGTTLTISGQSTLQNVNASIVTATTFFGNATLATTATNLALGAAGSIPYQSAVSATTFLAIGTNGYVMTSNGSAPVWSALGSISAGSATTATNLAAGVNGSVPYQSAPGVTAFVTTGTLGQLFQSNSPGNAPSWISTSSLLVGLAANIVGGSAGQIHYQTGANTSAFTANMAYSASGAASYTAATGQTLVVSSNGMGVTGNSYFANNLGVGGSMYLTGDLYVDGTQFIVNTTQIATGDKFLVLSTGTTSTALAVNSGLYVGPTTGTSYASLTFDGSANWVTGGTSGTGLKVTSVTSVATTNSGALQVSGGLGVGLGGFFGGTVTATTFIGNLTGNVTGNALTANTATSLANGAAGSLPYQSAVSATTFLAIGTSGFVLTSNGSAPVWTGIGTLVAGTATNANNVLTIQQPATGTYYPTLVFWNTATAQYQALYTTSTFSVNPATGLVTLGSLAVTNQSTLQSVTATLFTATTLTVNGNATVGGTFGVTGQTTLQSVTATLFTATTVTVNGNATVGGTFGVTGQTTLQSVTATLFTATTVTVNGNATVKTDLTVNGQTTLQSVTATLFTATTVTVNGDATIKGVSYHNGQSVFQSVTATLFTATTVTVNGNATVGGTFGVTGQTTLAGLTATNITGTTLTISGQSALQNVTAGIVTATTFFGNATLATTATNLALGAIGSIPYQSAVSATTFLAIGTAGYIMTVNAGGTAPQWTAISGLSAGTATYANSVLTVQQPTAGTYYPTFVSANNVTAAYQAEYTTSSFSIDAGTGIVILTGKLNVNNNSVSTATASANAIYTAGGIYATAGLTVAGPALFKDTVTFSGTATYVYSTNTVYTDNIIEVHTPPGGVNTNWNFDDGKDIGFRFHYYTASTDTNAALVLANDTKYLEWYASGAESTTSNFTSATYGTFKTGQIILTSATNSISTGTGALVVTGGVGISGALFVGSISTFTNSGSSLTGISGNALQVTAGGIGVSGSSYFASTISATKFQVGAAGLGTQVSNNSFDLGQAYLNNGGNTLSSTGVPGWGMKIGSSQNTLSTVQNTGVLAASTYHTISGYSISDSISIFTVTNLSALTINPIVINTSSVIVTNNLALQTNGGILINTTTNVTSTNTGALQVVGGVGIGGGLFVGGISTFTNLAIHSNVTPTNSTATGALTVAGGVGIGLGLFVGGVVTATNLTLNAVRGDNSNSGTQYAVFYNIATKELTTSTAASGSSTGTTSTFLITNSTPTSSTATGALVVYGGVGVWGGMNVGGITTVTNITAATSTATGAFQVKGGVGIGGSLYAGNIYTNGSQVTPTSIQEFTATAGQTTFTVAGGYTVGQIQVFANGIQLGTGDYTASNGTTVVLGIGRNVSDVVRVVVSQNYVISAQQAYTFNQYTATASQTTFATTYNTSTVQVFANGALISPTAYTANDGTSIIFGSGRTAGDIIAVISFNSVSIANAISSSGGTINGTLNVNGSLQQNGVDIAAQSMALSIAMSI